MYLMYDNFLLNFGVMCKLMIMLSVLTSSTTFMVK
jgi:hypothetical protein